MHHLIVQRQPRAVARTSVGRDSGPGWLPGGS